MRPVLALASLLLLLLAAPRPRRGPAARRAAGPADPAPGHRARPEPGGRTPPSPGSTCGPPTPAWASGGPTCCRRSAATAAITRQTLNLDEFGIPVATGVTDPFDIYRLQLRASQTIFDASVIGRLRAARDTAVAAGLDARAAGEIAGATAGLAYLRALSARETVRARQADSTIAAQLLGQARQLVDAGVSPAIDATRSEVSFASVRTQLEVARNAADRTPARPAAHARPALRARRSSWPIRSAPVALDIPLDPDGGRRVRPRASHRAGRRAGPDPGRAADPRRGPRRVSAQPGVERRSISRPGARPAIWAGTYNVQLQLTVPILDGFRRQNRVKEENLRVDIQEIRERDLVNQVETEARQAVLDLGSAQQQVAIAEDRLRLAEQELGQAQQRFQAGVAGSVETTNAQSSVIAARDARDPGAA